MSDQNKNQTPTVTESIAMAGTPLLGVATAAEAINAYGHVDAGWINHIPAADHLSSIGSSYAIGAAGGAVTERFAARLEAAGRDGAAERMRKFGNALTVMGSFACQLLIETSARGVGDKWDVISGVLATAPGLIAGRGYAKTFAPTGQPAKHRRASS